jgi:hypothetical protein
MSSYNLLKQKKSGGWDKGSLEWPHVPVIDSEGGDGVDHGLRLARKKLQRPHLKQAGYRGTHL